MLFAFEEKNRVYLLIYVICLFLMIGLIFFYLLDYQGMNRKFSWAPGGNSSHMDLLDSFLLTVIGRFIIILLIIIIFLYYFLITL
jgi:hypothetical protein